MGYFSYAAVKFEDMISHQKVQSKFVSHFYLSQARFVPGMYNSYIFIFILQCVIPFDYLDISR